MNPYDTNGVKTNRTLFLAAEQKPCIHMNIRYTNENVATKNNTNAFCYCQ